MGGETARKPDTIDELAATLQKGDQITTDVKSRALTVTDRWSKPVRTDIRAGEEYQIVNSSVTKPATIWCTFREMG